MKKIQSIQSRFIGFWGGAQKQAFLSALLVGLAAHIYKFTNTLYNHDALFGWSFKNDMVGSGRWFLSAASIPSSCFDLPWINGLLSLIYIGLTAAVISDIFKVRRRSTALLIGGLLAAFPCVTVSFFYEFTADSYMLAMLLAALSVRFNLVGDKNKLHIAIAALLVCLCCGIYQAYVSFALLLSMSHFIMELLNGDREDKLLYRWIGRQFIVYGAGLASYYAVWRLRLLLTGISPFSYAGIDDIGNMGGGAFAAAFGKMAQTFAAFFLGGNVFRNGMSFYALMNTVFLLTLAALLVYAAVKARLTAKWPRLVLMILSVVSLPVFACIWLFASPGVYYYPVMLQSLCLLYILAPVLAERFGGTRLRALAAVLFTVIVFKFTVQANQAYLLLDRCNRTSYTTASEMLTRIHLLDDGSVKKLAFVGGADESLVSAGAEGIEELTVLANMIQPTLIYDHLHASSYMVTVLDCGYAPVNDEELAELSASGQTDDMSVWPLKDSVRIIGDTAVIKLSD